MSIVAVGRTLPRWSVAGTVTPVIVGLPALRAGLPVKSAIVGVVPWLLARVPSPTELSLTIKLELADVRPPASAPPIRLNELAGATVPPML